MADLDHSLGAPADPEATGDGSVIGLLKRLRTLFASLTVTVNASDIEIGAVELKDGATDTRAKVGASTAIAESDNAVAAHDPSGGKTTDAAVTSDANGSRNSFLRGLVKILADVWDSTLHLLKVNATYQAALTDRSGTIAAGGTAQQLAAANSARRYLLIQNLSTGVLWVSTTTTAVVGQPSIALKACTAANDGTGGALVYEGSFIPTGAVSIIGATTSQAYSAREG